MTTSICLISLLLFGLTFSTQGTEEPQESYPQFKAEGLFLVDDEVVKKYMREIPHISDNTLKRQMAELEVHKDLNYTLSEVNKIFKTLIVHRLNISIFVRNITILEDIDYQQAVPNSQGGVTAKAVVHSLDMYLKRHGYSVKYRYDFVILFTGFDLYVYGESYPDGYANYVKVCDPEQNPIGAVEFLRTYKTVMTTARLIAYILGAQYDGAASKNIMTPYLTTSSVRRWYFQECSAVHIREYLNSIGNNNCLLRSNRASYEMSIKPEDYHGSLHDVDELCRRAMKNVSAYMAREFYSQYNKSAGDYGVCKLLPCKLPGNDYYQHEYSFDGLMCEVNKSCSKGRCDVYRTPNPNITSDCLYGNQPVMEILGKFSGSCEDYLNTYGTRECYIKYVFNSCCTSCKARRTGIAGCEYGDKNETCGTDTEARTCPRNSDICCNFCRNYNVAVKRSAELLDTEPLPRYDTTLLEISQLKRPVFRSDEELYKIVQVV